MLTSLNQRNEIRNPIIIFIFFTIIVIGLSIRQASQVAQLNELNSQLIQEQQKLEESNDIITKLQVTIKHHSETIDSLIDANEELKQKNSELLEQNKILSNDNKTLVSDKNKLEEENKELTKKYKEFVQP